MGGSHRASVALIVLSVLAATTAPAQKTPATNSLAKCEKAAGKEGAKLAKEMEKSLGGCLQQIADRVVKLGLEGDPADAAGKCAKEFRKLTDSRGLGKSREEKLRAKVAGTCDPAGNDHTLADLLGAGALVDEPLEVENLDTWCAELGGDGAIDDVDEWLDCMVAVNRCRTGQAVAARYPRILEWLDEVRTAVMALPPGSDPAAIDDAVDGIDAFVTMLDPNGDDQLDTRCVASGGLCAPGTFSVDGQTPCAPCPAGTFSDAPGAAACAPCPAGSAQSVPGATACNLCGPGFAQDALGQTACDACPAGSFAAIVGASACADCVAGKFAAVPGSSACTDCAAGQLSSPGEAACSPCPAGTFADVAGAAACDPCPVGRFASAPGATVCVACGLGTAQDEVGQAACEDCAPGTFAAMTESTTCTDCPPGRFAASPGQTACADCAVGTFAAFSGQTACEPCPAGRFGFAAGATTCLNCAAGTFAAAAGSTVCTNCPPDTYAPAAGLSQCFTCTGAAPGSSACDCVAP